MVSKIKFSGVLISMLIFSSCQRDWERRVIREITTLEKIMVETSESGDNQRQLELFSNEYSYIDISGNLVDKEKLVKRRNEDRMYANQIEVKDLEVIPLSRNIALSRGQWNSSNIYYGGIPRLSSSRYMAIWRRENGRWKVFRDQVTDIVDRTLKLPKLDRKIQEVNFNVGDYQLQNEFGLTIRIEEQNDTLVLSIPGKLEDGYVLYPTYDNTWFAEERPWRIQFSDSPDTLRLFSWSSATVGIRLK